jgi:hypothetical protein
MSLHLRLLQAERLDIRFNHLTNLKELCLDYKHSNGSHARVTNYFSYLPTSLEKLSIIGFDVEINSLSYLSDKLNFLELAFNNIFINNSRPFDCFKNLNTLIVNSSKIIFESGKKQIHFNLNNLEQLDLNEKSQGSYLFSNPFDNNLQLYFENLPKLKSLRFSTHSLSQIDLDLLKKLIKLENLEIWFHESTPFFMENNNLLSNFKQIKNLLLKCVKAF